MAIPDVENLVAHLFTVCFFMYLPDGSHIYGLRGGEFEGIGSVQGAKSCRIVFLGDTSYSLDQILVGCII